MVPPRAQVTKVCLPFQASPYLGTALPQLAFPTSMTYLPTSAGAAPTGSAGSQAVSAAPGGHGHQMMHHLLHHSAAGQQGGATNGTGRKLGRHADTCLSMNHFIYAGNSSCYRDLANFEVGAH